MNQIKRLYNNINAILTGERRVSELDKYRFICFVLAFVHAVLTIRFYLLRYVILFFYNIFAIIFYLYIGLQFTKQRKFKMLYYLCYVEITFFSAFATLLAGWDWGFMIYLIALTPVSFYLAYSSPQFGRSIRKPFFFVLTSMVVFIATRVISVHVPLLYTDHAYDTNLTIAYSFNAIVAFMSILLFSILFTIEIRQNEIRLEEQYTLLENISSKDPLTGLFNRRSMDNYLMDAVDQSKSKGLIFSIILGDIDDFKKVNDTYGHNVGDQVLVAVAKTIQETITPGCRICRWGGEEILIFIPENEIITKGYAEKIRLSIGQISIPTENDVVSVSMTFGLAEYSPGLPLNKLVSAADDRLYYGKHHGKNQVVDKIPN